MSNNNPHIEINGRIYNSDSCTPLELAWRKNEVEMHTLARGNYPGTSLPDDELPQMKSIGYWNAKTFQNWGLDYHRNEGIEICLLESGSLDFELNNKHFELSPNTLTITRPWIPHKLGSPYIGPSKLHWFILDVEVRQPHQQWKWPSWVILKKEDLDRLTDILRRNEQPVWQVNDDIKECFVKIGNLIKRKDPTFLDSKIKVLINHVLIQLLELFTIEKPILNDSLIHRKRSVEIFLENLNKSLSEDWTLNNMATYCGLGTTQFSKYCQLITNTTPTQYLNNLRMEKAAHLLKTEQTKTITDIAYDCGFSSNQYFTQVFKRQFSKSPTDYKRKFG